MLSGENIPRRQAEQTKIQSFAFVIAIVAGVLISVCLATSGFWHGQQEIDIELDGKINPNTASVSSLARLPGIGITRASAIVEYREDFSKKNNGRAAFDKPADMQKVKGIGPVTVEKIGQWLKFDKPAAKEN
jgi:competence ComEA-like helix-hairpin-helix protein